MWNYNMFVNRYAGTYYYRLKGTYLDHLDYVAFDSRYDVPFFACFNCWQWGHSQLGCRRPRKHSFCDNCGRINTTVDKCPRCARAYRKYFFNQLQKKDVFYNDVEQWIPCTQKRDPSTQHWECERIAKGSFFKDVDDIPFDPKVDVPIGVCYNCWEYGHARSTCLMPQVDDHCNNCGRIGVKVSNCPRCSNAAHRYWQKQAKAESHEIETKESQVKEKQYSGGKVHGEPLDAITSQTTEKSVEIGEESEQVKEKQDCGGKVHDESLDAITSQITEKSIEIGQESLNSVTSHISEGSFSQDEDDNYDNIVFEENEDCQNVFSDFVGTLSKDEAYYDDVLVDENEDSRVFTGAFLDSFLHLTNAIKSLPVKERIIIAQNFVATRRERITSRKTCLSQ